MVGVYCAFTKYNVRGGLFGSPFVGLDNFKFLFQSGKVWTLTANTILYNAIFIAGGLVLKVSFAIMLAEMSHKLVKKVSQTLMFLPHFVSMGLERFDFYGTPWIWYVIIPLVNFWKGTGYGTVVYLSAIMGISDDLYEAAELDGASFMQQVKHITLPCLRPTIVILLLMDLGGIVRGNCDLFYQLVGNVPLVRSTTEISDTCVFRAATETFDISRGTAVGLYQSVVGMLMVVGSNWLVRKVEPEMALF